MNSLCPLQMGKQFQELLGSKAEPLVASPGWLLLPCDLLCQPWYDPLWAMGS